MGLYDEVLRVIDILYALDEAREELIKLCRHVGRLARQIVLRIHAGKEVKGLLDEAAGKVKLILGYKDRYPELYHGGLVYDTLAEYVEAVSLASFVLEGRIPGFEELGVGAVPYLLGLADLIGELRRLVLSQIRDLDFGGAERTFKAMEEIYSALVQVAFPEAIVPGLRRKVDVAKRVIETTRKEMLFYRRSWELENRLRDLVEKATGT